jgi:hypothetical protein
MSERLRYLLAGLFSLSAMTAPALPQTLAPSSAPGPIMFLANIGGPFVDRKLAAQIGRDVISAKYPMAILSSTSPEVSDQGDTWVVILEVEKWTESVELLGGIKAIPVSIRKKDAAIMDIFTHGFERASLSDAVRKTMESTASCRSCHRPHTKAEGAK